MKLGWKNIVKIILLVIAIITTAYALSAMILLRGLGVYKLGTDLGSVLSRSWQIVLAVAVVLWIVIGVPFLLGLISKKIKGPKKIAPAAAKPQVQGDAAPVPDGSSVPQNAGYPGDVPGPQTPGYDAGNAAGYADGDWAGYPGGDVSGFTPAPWDGKTVLLTDQDDGKIPPQQPAPSAAAPAFQDNAANAGSASNIAPTEAADAAGEWASFGAGDWSSVGTEEKQQAAAASAADAWSSSPAVSDAGASAPAANDGWAGFGTDDAWPSSPAANDAGASAPAANDAWAGFGTDDAWPSSPAASDAGASAPAANDAWSGFGTDDAWSSSPAANDAGASTPAANDVWSGFGTDAGAAWPAPQQDADATVIKPLLPEERAALEEKRKAQQAAWPQTSPADAGWPQTSPANSDAWSAPSQDSAPTVIKPLLPEERAALEKKAKEQNTNWPQTAPADAGWPQTSPADAGWPQTTPADAAWPQTAPADVGWPQTSPADAAWPQTAPADASWPQTAPADAAWPQTAPADVGWPETTPATQPLPGQSDSSGTVILRAPQQPASGQRTCQFCGAPMPANGKFCGKCGRKQEG